jgi:hypothetical protein
MEKKFTALRVIAVIIKVLAWIVAGLTVLGFLGMLIMGATMGATMGSMMNRFSPSPYSNYQSMGAFGIVLGVVWAFSILMSGGFMFIGLLASSDLIMVILAVEENTRAMRPPATTT